MVGKSDYQAEKEARERRLMAYAEAIQKRTQEKSSQIIKELVDKEYKVSGANKNSINLMKRVAQ